MMAMIDESASGGSYALGSTSTPLGLMASASRTLTGVLEEYDSDEDYCWAGDEEGLDYGDVTKSKSPSAGYMLSCNHSQIVSTLSLVSSFTTCISLPKTLLAAICSLCKSSIHALRQASGLVNVNTGATDHMIPEKLAFISYKRVIDLSRGTTVFSLNGKQVLVCPVLHVPDLAVSLNSLRLRAHLQQCGCNLLGTFDDGFHVYFPSFVLSIDM